MTDRLLSFVQNPAGRRVARALGLPAPHRLVRRVDGWSAQELAGRAVALIAPGGDSALMASLADTIHQQGGTVAAAGLVQALVVDASQCTSVAALRLLFEQMKLSAPRLASGAKVLMLTAGESAADVPEVAACAQAVQGFMRSLAKELGRRGITVNLLVLIGDGPPALEGALRYFCSDRSAYVSGQVLRWSRDAGPPGSIAGHRTALVTGAAGGIGAATARRLSMDGLRVLCVDVPAARPALEALAREVNGPLLPLDLAAPGAPVELADAVRRLGGLDVLVHNAGITRDRTLGRMTLAEWDSVLAVNLSAIIAIDAQLDAAGLLNPGGREICVSSISGMAGNAGQTNYSATKAALIGYVAARSTALAPRGVTVNAVAPGFIETAMTHKLPWLVREGGRRINSLKQGGLPSDVAEAIAFIASAQAQPVNGQTLRVCGQSLLGA
ncbi:MAG: 3-oxoacyl-ACP reductase [Burkholderiaceae bacterium]